MKISKRLAEELRTAEQVVKPSSEALQRECGEWTFWRCGLCENVFGARLHNGEPDDGRLPGCCPYCGQQFHVHLEFE